MALGEGSMTCKHCGKESPEGVRPATQAWCVACQRTLLAPPETFMGFPRVDVETRGNAKWAYRLGTSRTPLWKVIEVKIHRPGVDYRVEELERRDRIYIVTGDRLDSCLRDLAEYARIEARALLVDARTEFNQAQTKHEDAKDLVRLLAFKKEVEEANVPGFWERLHGVESDHGTTRF